MKLCAFLVAMVLVAPGMALADDDGCDFAPPTPLLKAHAYTGQSFVAKADHDATETAALAGGVRLTIEQHQCVDSVSRDFVLTAPNDPKKRDFAAWTDFAQGTLRALKMRNGQSMTELIDFLKTARAMKPKGGVVSICRNGKVSDECNWESGGRLSIEVKPGPKTTRITVSEIVSG